MSKRKQIVLTIIYITFIALSLYYSIVCIVDIVGNIEAVNFLKQNNPTLHKESIESFIKHTIRYCFEVVMFLSTSVICAIETIRLIKK